MRRNRDAKGVEGEWYEEGVSGVPLASRRERHKLPQRGPRPKRVLVYLELKKHLMI